MNFLLQTFGCKSNQYESQGLRETLLRAGHAETDTPAEADLYIINTCGVTGRAGASCRNAIRKALRANPALRIAITGCGVDLGEEWPDVGQKPLLIPNAQKHEIAARLAVLFDRPPEALPREDRFALEISRFHGHTRAFIKIQDGCDNFCSYCAVPRARGAPESRPSDAVIAEAQRLIDNGHAELVLTGINIGAYRRDELDLADLAARLAALPGLSRLRLGSVEPPSLTERLVSVMADNPAICPHVHLPLQSGDDGTLRAMRRRYVTADFMKKIDLLHKRLDRPAVSTDVIVGFPGEDDAAAERTEALCRRAGFSRLHVFLFSPRSGTPAAAMQQTAADRDIEARKSRLIAIGRALSRDYAAKLVGMEERVIVEQNGGGLCDRYVRVDLDLLHSQGETLRVRLTASKDGKLAGSADISATR